LVSVGPQRFAFAYAVARALALSYPNEPLFNERLVDLIADGPFSGVQVKVLVVLGPAISAWLVFGVYHMG
jgi:hypothetical protein